ncbi:hypothetical protein [Dictyobacter arantiisoli]|uniref:Uncharacterized protein n=1 Tax=Dictyobacter arantiisoli TaxID=2014874 RepID=A0A5A5TJ80_9CHLR|nr:hypothetical protein [Dictyobacter arantiisoli]GCF11059.1 hypothetical protein KDI_46230 [Dictyobacter arantiisoli]
MSDNETAHPYPISVVRFGMGKEIQLYSDELVVTGIEQTQELRVPLASLRRLTLMPGDPTPSKLVLLADLDDDSTVILAEGMTNARDFREMLPHLTELCPDLELEPSDMGEQLRQALSNQRAWNLTCLGACVLVCIIVYALYLIVAFIGTFHH